MTEDISKLPKWAQREISRLRADIASQAEAIRKLTGEEPSNVEVDPYSVRGDEPRRFLRDRDRVRFHLGQIDQRLYVDVSLDSASVFVIGSDMLSVKPGSSNTIHIEVVER